MSDLISREALIEDLNAARDNNGMGAVIASTLIRYVKRQPAVDAIPVVHAEWRPDEMIYSVFRRYKCSECGELTDNTCMEKPRYNFCPWCGAKTDGGKCNG